jgi:glycosyltransferase involved in cell wall biosynthesis
VRTLGFLSKADQQSGHTLKRLFAESHFLLVPSRADCAPAAVREASAYGLPSVTSDVGGLGSIVRNGRNGRAFPQETAAATYADYIAEVFGNTAGYRRLALASFEEYQTRLSWESAGRTVKQLLGAVLSARQVHSDSMDAPMAERARSGPDTSSY